MCKVVTPETWPLCPGAESNLGDRALGEVEENSSIALSIKEGCTRGLCLKPCVPAGKDLMRSFMAAVQRPGSDEDEGVCSLHSFSLALRALLMS